MMIGSQHIQIKNAKYGTYMLTMKGRRVVNSMESMDKLTISKELWSLSNFTRNATTLTDSTKPSALSRKPSWISRRSTLKELSKSQDEILKRLLELRSKLSTQWATAPYNVASENTLRNI